MFYDIFLDEVLYLSDEKLGVIHSKPDIFSGLDSYNRKEKKSFKNGKIIILKKEKDIDKFINISRNVLVNNEKLYYGKFNNKVSLKIKNITSYNLKGFNLSLQRNNFKHIEKEHGNVIIENNRNQSNVTDYDFYLIPNIISEADLIKKSRNIEHNNKSLIFIKEIDNIVYHLVTYISFKSHNLEVKTLYKKHKI